MVSFERRLLAVAVAAAGTIVAGCAAGQAAHRPMAFPGSGPVAAATANRPSRTLAAAVVDTALSLLGRPYRPGGASPEAGFDCSGLVAYVMRQHDIAVARTVGEQWHEGLAVTLSNLQPGDLVFFSTTGPGATHVGIVVVFGSSRQFVHAPADGSTVRMERFDTPYWQRRWVGARRLLPLTDPSSVRRPTRASGPG